MDSGANFDTRWVDGCNVTATRQAGPQVVKDAPKTMDRGAIYLMHVCFVLEMDRSGPACFGNLTLVSKAKGLLFTSCTCSLLAILS